jgi:16S rRNA processing protein RimM
MIPENLHPIGHVTKLHGFRGELTVFLDTSVPDDYADVEHVFLDVRGTLVPYKVELLEQKTKNSAKVKLLGVDDEATARTLLKCNVLIDRDELTEADEMRVELNKMEGYQVVDATFGTVGILERVLELSGNPQLEIRNEKGLVLIPLQEKFIQGIDHEAKVIRVDTPPGLIELFLSESDEEE